MSFHLASVASFASFASFGPRHAGACFMQQLPEGVGVADVVEPVPPLHRGLRTGNRRLGEGDPIH